MMLEPMDQPDIAAAPTTTTRMHSQRCANGCLLLLKLLHCMMIVILTAAVIILGLQYRKLQQQLTTQNAKIDNLVSQVENQQINTQDLNERVEQEHDITIFQMAGTFTLLSCLLTAFHITQHLSNYQKPVIQRKIVAILWMSPIYSVTSFFSLVFPDADGYLAVIKDFYEAYVIYQFLSFLIVTLGQGDRDTAVSVLARHADHLRPPTKCLSYHPPPDSSKEAMANAVLTECQISAMQFVLVRPITSILHFLANMFVEPNDDNNDGYAFLYNPNFYISMITNVSVFFAFNGLLKFYHAVAEDLAWIRPFRKFMAIKGIVFLTFWQGLLITIIVSLQHSKSTSSTVSESTASPHPAMAPNSHFAPTFAPTTYDGATVDVLNNHTRFLEGDDDAATTSHQMAAQIQNFLICLEMLFFSIAHWCVFPAEEWAPDYRPKRAAQPGIALKDFAKDISYIINTRSNARAYRRGNSSIPAGGSELSSLDSGVVIGEDELELREMT